MLIEERQGHPTQLLPRQRLIGADHKLRQLGGAVKEREVGAVVLQRQQRSRLLDRGEGDQLLRHRHGLVEHGAQRLAGRGIEQIHIRAQVLIHRAGFGEGHQGRHRHIAGVLPELQHDRFSGRGGTASAQTQPSSRRSDPMAEAWRHG